MILFSLLLVYEIQHSNSICGRAPACYGEYTDTIYLSDTATETDLIHEEGHALVRDTLPACGQYVSAYARASKDKWESGAEAFTLYKMGGINFRNMARRNECLQTQYDYLKKNFYEGKEYKTYLKYKYSITL
jgi:hypothetical protein